MPLCGSYTDKKIPVTNTWYTLYSCEIDDFVETHTYSQAVCDTSIARVLRDVYVCPHEGYRPVTPIGAS